MFSGILFVLGACFCWALVFVLPPLAPSFHSLEIALGRFFVYGLFSFLLLLWKKRHFFSKAYLPYWRKSLLLAFCSTLLAYTGTVLNIKYAGPTLATLMFAMTSMTVPLFGNLKNKESSLRQFILPFPLMVAGLILTKWESFETSASSSFLYLIGVSAGFLGLFSWTWFIVTNCDFLKQNKEMPAKDWTLMLGTTSFFQVLLTGAFLLPLSDDPFKYFTLSPENQTFFIISILLGAGSTLLPFYLWNQGAPKLPISLSGQLMISQIIFALLLIFALEKKVPTVLELGGISLMLIGVVAGFKILHRPQTIALDRKNFEID
jgi:drug/metabolite transporter (DMT)-like permease